MNGEHCTRIPIVASLSPLCKPPRYIIRCAKHCTHIRHIVDSKSTKTPCNSPSRVGRHHHHIHLTSWNVGRMPSGETNGGHHMMMTNNNHSLELAGCYVAFA